MLASILITSALSFKVLVQSAGLFVVATFIFDAIHFALHQCLKSRHRRLRNLGRPHQAHHTFFDRRLKYHQEAAVRNLLHHVIPEYVTQMLVCGLAFAVMGQLPVIIVMAGFTTLFAGVMMLGGKDAHHIPFRVIPVARESLFVGAAYHVMHHIYPDSYLSSHTTLFDGLMGTACQIAGRRVALTGASGAFGSAMKELLERAGARVVTLKFGVDWSYENYSGADAALEGADILVLAHRAKGQQAMQANCDSFLTLIGRFRRLTGTRQVPPEVWAIGSEIEFHPTFRNPGLSSYARSKRAFARATAGLQRDPDILYRHIVASAFCSRMGGGLMTGRTAATIALWLIRRGFRYIPVTYTGIAFVNFVPYFLRGLRARQEAPRRERFSSVPFRARELPTHRGVQARDEKYAA
jgi:hypothetical protein